MDAIDSVVDPLRDFAKDSIRLVKRCHKPDRKGITSPLLLSPFFLDSYDACERSVWFYCLICWIYLRMRKIYMLNGQIPCCMSESVWFGLVWFCRIHESGGPYSDRFCSNGVRGILCEAHLYSHQQHHRRCYLKDNYRRKRREG
uniref:Uncharacterized protein n=1 Tax=Brassica oleracea TaxID=3712 RepID=A0A3P6E840_BRAOL|nr:unnamed protein product [Brassica oleracea]